MSMVSYAAGSRYLSLLGGVCMSFYDWYCDLPPASPQTWGEQTDVPESADWYNSGFLILWGSNVPQTRTPDAHFYTEVRYKGAKSVVISPDYSEASKFADLWISVKQGTDAALAMAMGHVILRESTSTGRRSISRITPGNTPTCRCWFACSSRASTWCPTACCAHPTLPTTWARATIPSGRRLPMTRPQRRSSCHAAPSASAGAEGRMELGREGYRRPRDHPAAELRRQ